MSKNTSTQQSKKPACPPTIKCEDFKIVNYSYTELDTSEDKKKKQTQFLAWPRYKHKSGDNKLIIETGEIKITQYGFPTLGDYYKTNDLRNFVKLGFDPEQPACNELKALMSQIDEHAIANKDNILKKYAKLYKYQSIVRPPGEADELSLITDDDDNTKKKDKKPKFDFCKLKLDIDYETKNISTGIFVKKTPKSKAELKDVRDASDLDKYLTFGSTVRFILTANKLWAAKNKNENGDRKYGVSFKILQMEIQPREQYASTKELFSKYNLFTQGSEEEGEDENENSPSNEENSGNHSNNQEENNDDLDALDTQEDDPQEDDPQEESSDNQSSGDDIVEEGSSDDPEPEPEPEPVKPPTRGRATATRKAKQ